MASIFKPAVLLPLLAAIAAAVAACWFAGFEKEALSPFGGIAMGASAGIFYTRLAVLPICVGAGFVVGTRIPVYHLIDQVFPLFLLALVVFYSVMRWYDSSETSAP